MLDLSNKINLLQQSGWEGHKYFLRHVRSLFAMGEWNGLRKIYETRQFDRRSQEKPSMLASFAEIQSTLPIGLFKGPKVP